MDIDFMIQDTFALTRPQWKLCTNLEEAGRSFAEAVAQNYQAQEPGKPTEPDESSDDTSSEDGVEEDELRVPETTGAQSSSEEIEADVCFLAFNSCSRYLSLTVHIDTSQRRGPDS